MKKGKDTKEDQRVKCKCGEMPEMAKKMNAFGYNTVGWRLECPNCGPKGASWRHSRFIATFEWENEFFKK